MELLRIATEFPFSSWNMMSINEGVVVCPFRMGGRTTQLVELFMRMTNKVVT